MNTLFDSSSFWHRLKETQNPEAIVSLMGQIDDLERKFAIEWRSMSPSEAAISFADNFQPTRFRIQAIRNLRALAGDNHTLQHDLIRKALLPRCLGLSVDQVDETPRSTVEDGTKTIRPNGADEASWEAHQMRQELAGWLSEMSGRSAEDIRASVISQLCDALSVESTLPEHRNGASWTILEIGYRSDQVVKTLKHVISTHEDLVGDIALSVLVSIGGLSRTFLTDDTERDSIVASLISRMEARPNRFLAYSLSLIASPELLQDTVRLYSVRNPKVSFTTGEYIDQDEGHLDDSLRRSALAQFSKMVPDEPFIQDIIWKTLYNSAQASLENRDELLYDSNLSAFCNSEHVVPDLFSFLSALLDIKNKNVSEEVSNRKSEGPPNHWIIYIAGSRAIELNQPRQLAGWLTVTENNLTPFRKIALTNTEQVGYHTTSPMLAKELAWKVLAWGGGRWSQSDIEFVSNPQNETSGFVRGKVFDVLSYFGCHPFPKSLTDIIQADDDIDNHKDSSEFSAFRGAETLARSSANLDAFSALLNAGFLIHGRGLDSTAEALSEVSVTLTRAGKSFIADDLLERVESPSPKHQRVAALLALHTLAQLELLPPNHYQRLMRIASSSDLDEYSRSWAAHGVGYTRDNQILPELTEELESVLDKAITSANNRENKFSMLANQTVETLIRLDSWHSDALRRKVLEHIGLYWVDGEWHLSNAEQLESSLVPSLVMLYRSRPHEFELAITDAVKHAKDKAHYALLVELSHPQQGLYVPFPKPIIQCLVSEFTEIPTSWRQRLYIFQALAVGAPLVLLSYDWYSHFSNWSSAAKVALLDAIKLAAENETNTTNEDFENLRLFSALRIVKFVGDPSYEVRRAVCCTLQVLYEDVLLSHIVYLVRDGAEVQERQLAAEIIRWAGDSTSHTTDIISSLRWDRERVVRDTAIETMQQRHSKANADLYMEHVYAVVDFKKELGTSMAYGWALTRLGDDRHLKKLQDIISNDKVRPNIRTWILALHKALDEQWTKTKESWPTPSLYRMGSIVGEVNATVFQGDSSYETKVSIWENIAHGPRGKHSWQGAFELLGDFGGIKTGKAELRIKQQISEIILKQVTYKDRINDDAKIFASFIGNGPFPDE